MCRREAARQHGQTLQYHSGARLINCLLVQPPTALALPCRAACALLIRLHQMQAEPSATQLLLASETCPLALRHPDVLTFRRAAALDVSATVLSVPVREALEPLTTPGQVSASWPCLDCIGIHRSTITRHHRALHVEPHDTLSRGGGVIMRLPDACSCALLALSAA